MPSNISPDVRGTASELRTSVSLLVRRLRRIPGPSGLTTPEASALARLDRCGPTSASDLARAEQISPQSMSATLATLETKGCIARTPDPDDGRRALVTMTARGRTALRHRRDERTTALARALADELDPTEVEALRRAVSLIERVAQGL
jgi:DNA-binding MarR family transcriptional regulator